MEGGGCRTRVVVWEGAIERLSGGTSEDRGNVRALGFCSWLGWVKCRCAAGIACVEYVYMYNMRVLEVEGSQCLCDQWIDGCFKK